MPTKIVGVCEGRSGGSSVIRGRRGRILERTGNRKDESGSQLCAQMNPNNQRVQADSLTTDLLLVPNDDSSHFSGLIQEQWTRVRAGRSYSWPACAGCSLDRWSSCSEEDRAQDESARSRGEYEYVEECRKAEEEIRYPWTVEYRSLRKGLSYKTTRPQCAHVSAQ